MRAVEGQAVGAVPEPRATVSQRPGPRRETPRAALGNAVSGGVEDRGHSRFTLASPTTVPDGNRHFPRNRIGA